MARDFYQVLGVPRDASEREITAAYRKLARQHHPDVSGGGAASEARFKEINAAHAVLGDAKKRAAYNQWGDQWEHAEQLEQMQRERGFGGGFGGRGGPFGGRGGGAGGVQFDFRDAAFGDQDLGDMFGNLFGGARPRPPSRGQDRELPIELSLQEAFQGAARTVRTGQGRQIEAALPPGVDTGARIKLAGQGEPSPHGGETGDLILLVTVAADGVFERRGEDVHVFVDVPVTTAALGGEAVVPSLSGKGLALRIPPQTQNGRVFRLTGQGMPRFRASGRGDLLAEVSLQLTLPLSEDQQELYEELRALEAQDEAWHGAGGDGGAQ